MSIGNVARLTYLKARAGSSAMTQALLQEPFYFPTWPLSPSEGRKIIKRQFNFCGYSVEMAGRINWHMRDVSMDWHREFFSYKWLQDVASINSEKIASSFAREFINGFTLISKIDDVHESAWELEVVGERLTHWLYYRHFVLAGGSKRFYSRYQKSLVQHVAELYQHIEIAPEALGPSALKGLIAASTIIPQCSFMLDAVLHVLDALLERDILPDGGHISASPNHHLSFIKTLIEIRELLESADIAFDPLDEAIASLGEMLHFFCHGDGRLALFKSNLMEDALVIARAIELSYEQKSPPILADYSGYAKLMAGDVTLFMRMGAKGHTAPPLGIGAIEFSDKDERILVNCGTYYGASEQWHDALSHPSAFSALSLDADDLPVDDVEITQSAEAKASRKVLDVSYGLSSLIRHERQVQLSDDGLSCKGKDMLEIGEIESDTFKNLPAIAARFHLHPDIRCQAQKEGGYILKSVSGSEWVFSCSLPKHVSVEESVYLGYYGKPQKTLQLAVRIPMTEMSSGLRWELKKLTKE